MNLQELSAQANELKSALEQAHDLADVHHGECLKAGLPEINKAFANATRGCVATALDKIKIHIQSLEAKAAAEKTGAK